MLTPEDKDWFRGYSDVARERGKSVWSKGYAKATVELARNPELSNIEISPLWSSPYGQGRGAAGHEIIL